MTTIKKRKHKLDAHRDRILSGLKQGKKRIDILREITVITGQSITPQTLRNWLKENGES
ncbi:hypothetical protein QNE82_001471 [Vibrio alginolyticus]|nr:hypothetical protein [Vibrio alginolyticus]